MHSDSKSPGSIRCCLSIAGAAVVMAVMPLMAQEPYEGRGEIRFTLIDGTRIDRGILPPATITFDSCVALTLEQGGADRVRIPLSNLRSIRFVECVPGTVGVPLISAPYDAAISISISPNPLSSGATIELTTSAGSEADIRILTLDGVEVRRFERQHTGDGKLRVEWDTRHQSGRELPSGTYLIVATTGNGTVSRALQLIR